MIKLVLIYILFNQTLNGKVVGVTDGDTITILSNNKQYKIRLAEIDAPEKTQAFGTRAKIALSEKVFGEMATIKVSTKDRYGRIVGYVFVQGKNINKEMVKEGYAWFYNQYGKDISIKQEEFNARLNRQGLWVENNPIPPWEYRRLKKKR